LLAGKLVPVVVIHSLAGLGITRLTHNRVPHNQHKMRITQATSNPLEYLLALRRRKVKNPSQSPRSEPKTSTFLRSTILAAPSGLGARQPPRETSESCSKTQSPSAFRCNHSRNALGFTSNLIKDDESMMEISVRALDKLTRLLCQCKRPRE
jgi:hypothetical protein